MYSYASIDIETSGLDPSRHDILQVGIVLDDLVSPLDQLPQAEWIVVHEEIVGEPIALAMNASLISEIAGELLRKNEDLSPGFIWPGLVDEVLHQFLDSHGFERVTAAGKNFASFDKRFFEEKYILEDCFRHRSLDPGSMYWTPADGAIVPNMHECMKRAGIEGEVKHTALADALTVVKLIRAKHGIPW